MSSQPVPNLLVIRSADLPRAVRFYETLGLSFERHAHGNGPEHFASDCDAFVFEIYPQKDSTQSTVHTRIGFRVSEVDNLVETLRGLGVSVLSPPADSDWGRRAVVRDFDGHKVELLSAEGI